MGLCDNCALKYADCKGNKSLEKCHCDYYKKPIVMNVKELAERVAELEIKLKDSVEVVRCKDCRYFKKIAERSDSGLCHRDIVASAWKENGYCSRGKRKGGDTE